MGSRSRAWPIEQLLADSEWLKRLASRVAGHPADAQDAVQDTWLAALRTPPDSDRPAQPWLGSVLRHLVLRRRREAGRRLARERDATSLHPEAADSADEALERLELHRTLAGLVLELEEPFRSTLVQRFFEGRTGAEIARAAGIPEGTVRWRLSEAIARLRCRLDQRLGGRDAWRALLLVRAKEVVLVKLTTKVTIAGAVLLLAMGSSILLRNRGSGPSPSGVVRAIGSSATPLATPTPAVHRQGANEESTSDAVRRVIPRFRGVVGSVAEADREPAPTVAPPRPAYAIPAERWFDFTQQELERLAANCEIRLEAPGVQTLGNVPMEWMNDQRMLAAGVAPEELPLVREVVRDYREAANQALRAWVAVVSGEPDLGRDVDFLHFSNGEHPAVQRMPSYISMRQISEAARRVALELAGQAPVAKVADRAIDETAVLYREQLRQADGFEAALASKLGPERARALRRGPLTGRHRMAGCM